MLYCCTQEILLPLRRIIFWSTIVITLLLFINRSKLNLYFTHPVSKSAEIIGIDPPGQGPLQPTVCDPVSAGGLD